MIAWGKRVKNASEAEAFRCEVDTRWRNLGFEQFNKTDAIANEACRDSCTTKSFFSDEHLCEFDVTTIASAGWRASKTAGSSIAAFSEKRREEKTMSLWLDMLRAEIRFVNTPSFGRTRIAEAGRGHPETLVFLHGIGGHLEAYSKNVMPLSDRFHVIAYDYVGHGLFEKKVMEYTPYVLGDHLG